MSPRLQQRPARTGPSLYTIQTARACRPARGAAGAAVRSGRAAERGQLPDSAHLRVQSSTGHAHTRAHTRTHKSPRPPPHARRQRRWVRQAPLHPYPRAWTVAAILMFPPSSYTSVDTSVDGHIGAPEGEGDDEFCLWCKRCHHSIFVAVKFDAFLHFSLLQ